jgi:5'-nucleotidase (lipoprotein e(P4) family)
MRSPIYYAAAPALFISIATFASVCPGQQPVPAQPPDLDYQIGATLFMQKAAEFRALSFQAFNLARWQLDTDLDKKNVRKLPKGQRKRQRAIIVDIDETVLDNSPAQVADIKNHRSFNLPTWYEWSKMQSAKAIPGSVDFLNYATAKGVKVFYLSNRDELQKQDTIENLRKVGFKDVSAGNVLMREKDAAGNNISTKTPRREFVSQRYRVVLLVGDNLDDFSDVFERKSVAERFAEVEKIKTEWGKRWIVIPNAMYGTWESAIYEYQRLTDQQKAEKRAAALELP